MDSFLKRFYKRNCRARVIGSLAKLGKAVNRYHENLNYDYHTNGEQSVLEILNQESPTVLFDVGAYQGTWASMAHEACPSARIYSFEPVPWAFEKLKNESKVELIETFNYALGRENGSRKLIAYQSEASHLSGFFQFPHNSPKTEIEVEVQMGDQVINNLKIDKIDFLKIDTEGSELEVIQGFEKTLAKRGIRVIQFEYGQVNVFSRYLLKDYYDYFAKFGYKIGKIYPQGVTFSEYRPDLEDFIGPNYIAVASDDKIFSCKTQQS